MKNLSDITAVILAGGLGTRLRPVIGDRPKVLAEVGGRPFIAYLLDQLAAVRVRKVVLCTGFMSQQVKGALGENFGSMSLCYSEEPIALGTAGALRLALPLLKSDVVLVMNGDSFCETNLKAFYLVHRLREAKATILVREVPDTSRFGWIEIENDGRISGFIEKHKTNGPGWINAGIYLIHRPLLETISPDRMVSLEKDIFPSWIGKGLYGFRCQGQFLDIGTPESYLAAQQGSLSERVL
jgi:NDP-sugar pyrophosphorylase family protein